MIKVGITGQAGFVGWHLYHTLGLYPDAFATVAFEKAFFDDDAALDGFVQQCDVIVHLAAMNRHPEPQVIYDTNIGLTHKLVASLERTGAAPHVLFSSSTQEERDNLYGKSKREGRDSLASWAKQKGAPFTGLIIPNVFGPFGQPFYNSVIATFCHQLCHGEMPRIDVDGELGLIYVGELVQEIITCIHNRQDAPEWRIAPTKHIKVSQILELLQRYRSGYLELGIVPELTDAFERNLFNTFRSFIKPESIFPRAYVKHSDQRGDFVEVIRLETGGQVSFSTTHRGITRGNHYHTRKVERFSVIKGKAKIQLRKIGTSEVHDFYLDGNEPAYVDMPVWYTHNIQNIGDDVLYTIFWINEFFDPNDPDTFFEVV
jgi:UDP-2-acetamido-2,6-beta-L-arabino-hexul-4-ose reductase